MAGISTKPPRCIAKTVHVATDGKTTLAYISIVNKNHYLIVECCRQLRFVQGKLLTHATVDEANTVSISEVVNKLETVKG